MWRKFLLAPKALTFKPQMAKSKCEKLSLAMVLTTLAFCLSHSYHVTMPPLLGKAGSLSERDVAIIIVPEVGVAHVDYKIYGHMVQQIYPLRLWVSLMDTSSDRTLSLDNLPILLGESMQELSAAGLQSDADILIATHGHRSQVVADYTQALPSTVRGLVLLGTLLSRQFSLSSYPVPVLTVVGELDGIVRLTRVAQTVHSMIGVLKSDVELISHNPLVVLNGANHDVFIAGDLPVSLYTLDINAEVDTNVAMTTASNLTAMFIACIVQEPERFVELAKLRFMEEFDNSKKLTEPIRNLMEMTQNNLKSYWVKSAQKWLSGLEGKHSTQLEVDSYIVGDRVPLPPTLLKEHGISYVITFSDIIPSSETTIDNLEGGLGPVAPEEIAARMLGPGRIQQYLKDTIIARNYTCRDLNYASFMTAYHTASERARTRYNNYHRGIIFEPDIVTDSEALWEITRLKLKTLDQVLHVTSISYQTANEKVLSEYAGLYFCKLLPPDRALEWIYVDSLRRSMI